MSPSTRPKKTYTEITRRLQAMIEAGNLKPGDRLPPERQLAVLFTVSRNSLREAIKGLEQQGVLESRPGAGTFITETNPADLARHFEEIFALERLRLEDIFELRLLLEPRITHLAAERISTHALEQLRELIESHEHALRENLPCQDFDQSFHDTSALATGNHAIVKLMERMHDLLDESRDETLQSPARCHTSLQDHKKILAALRARDTEAACNAMMDHLTHTREIVFTSNDGE